MTLASQQPQVFTRVIDAPGDRAAPLREVRKFLATSLAFCVGLVLTVGTAEALLARRNAREVGKRLIGREVYEAVKVARRRGPGVKTLYLGDSVARQLFRHGSEPRPDVRYVTSNYAVAVAGQYYLLEYALKSCPNVREVNLFLVPGVWGHDLGPPFTDDYFCGHFHTAHQVAEVWRVKHDLRLTAVHASRLLLPNLLAENAAHRPQAPAQAPAGAHPVEGWLAPAGGEPLLTWLAHLVPPPAQPPGIPAYTADDGTIVLPMSRVSRYYLARIRGLCRERNVRLRLLPAPCGDVARYRDVHGVYDGPIIYVDPAQLLDGTHIRPEYLDQVRSRVVSQYDLDIVPAP